MRRRLTGFIGSIPVLHEFDFLAIPGSPCSGISHVQMREGDLKIYLPLLWGVCYRTIILRMLVV